MVLGCFELFVVVKEEVVGCAVVSCTVRQTVMVFVDYGKWNVAKGLPSACSSRAIMMAVRAASLY